MKEQDLPQPGPSNLAASSSCSKRRFWTAERIGAVAGTILGPIFIVMVLVLTPIFQDGNRTLADDVALIVGFVVIGAIVGGIAGKVISRFHKEKEKST